HLVHEVRHSALLLHRPATRAHHLFLPARPRDPCGPVPGLVPPSFPSRPAFVPPGFRPVRDNQPARGTGAAHRPTRVTPSGRGRTSPESLPYGNATPGWPLPGTGRATEQGKDRQAIHPLSQPVSTKNYTATATMLTARRRHMVPN